MHNWRQRIHALEDLTAIVWRKPLPSILKWVYPGILIILLCACQTTAMPEPAAAGVPQESLAQEEAPDQAQNPAAASQEAESGAPLPVPTTDPQALWQTSPHADTFVLSEDDKNSSCARCHSPVNWVPTMDDMPESCYSCKFEVDPPPPKVEAAEWENIQCNVCHRVKKNQVEAQIAWLEVPPIEEYSEVASAAELCTKCHAAQDLPGHAAIQVGGAHLEMGCTQCHDAHSTAADCSTAGCHESLDAAQAPVPGHDADHQNVSCSACHDASGLDVGPDDTGQWVTFTTINAGGQEETIPFTSHQTALDAPCARCHFEGNPWGLGAEVEENP